MAYSSQANVTPTTSHTGDAGVIHAYNTLHFGFVLLPILAGIDKFFDIMANWDAYLAPIVTSTLHIGAHQFMQVVGVIEIVAGLIVAFKPRVGAYIVALWLAGIIVNLALTSNHYWDVAARDLILLLAAMSLGSLSAWASHREKHTA